MEEHAQNCINSTYAIQDRFWMVFYLLLAGMNIGKGERL